MMRTLIDIAWAAGVIEGEGCLIVHGAKDNHNQVRLAVEMTDLDVLEKLQGILGPNAKLRERKPPSLNPNHRRRYILTLNGRDLIGWVQTLYHFMGTRRRKKIIEILDAWKAMRNAIGDFEISEIVRLRRSGYDDKQVASMLNRHVAAVQRIWRRYGRA